MMSVFRPPARTREGGPPSRRRVLTLASLAFAAIPIAADAASATSLAALPSPLYVMPDTESWEIVSEDGAKYRILVSRPAGKAPEGGYPLLYVLDGNAMFAGFAEARRIQEEFNPGVGRSIIVGIGYPTDQPYDGPRRIYDFTPEMRTPLPPAQRRLSQYRTGGHERFLDFILHRLQPEIARRHRVDPERTALYGHSLGGLFALHVLFTRPEAFHAIIAASPSLWWNDQGLLEEERHFSRQLADGRINGPARLFLVAGRREESIVNTWDTEALAKRLEPLSAFGLRTRLQIFEEENHLTVPARSVTPALRFAFTWP